MAGGSFLGIGLLVLSILIGIKLYDVFKVPPLPDLQTNVYWGPGSPPLKRDTSVRPFQIKFSEEMITDLKYRLKSTRYTEPLEGIAFQYGFNQKTLKNIVEFWANEYDFVKSETFLNQFPHFVTNVQGLDIHFIRVKPKVSNGNIKVLPLLLLHGWPGSVREFYKLIPLLTSPKKDSDFVFEVIVPSLPGFGFSQASSKPGFGTAQIAIVMANLMRRLGHERYYVQGGDWGSVIGANMATLFQVNVLGYHSNFPSMLTPLSHFKLLIGSIWPSWVVEEKFKDKLYPISTKLKNLMEESGYFHEQGTKPDTVGVGLDNSPSALAAWILEKFSTGTNLKYKNLVDGGITKKFTLTELIDNLMFYWTSQSATTSARIYAESFTIAHRALGLESIPTKVPTAVARFPNEILFSTEWQLKEKYLNLLQVTDLPRGGHFAAFEEPELLASDIESAILKFEAFHMKSENKK